VKKGPLCATRDGSRQ